MDNTLYIAMTGASETMRSQTIHANNLANATTTGFREDLARARSMQVFGEGFPTSVYAMTENPGTNFAPGPLIETGRDLDIAVEGEGWIAVLGPDGSEAYTRAGQLYVDAFGQMVTGNNLPVMGNNGPILVNPTDKIRIADDGSLSIQQLGQGPEVLTLADRIKLVKPDLAQLEKGQDGLFRLPGGGEEFPDGSVRVLAGYLEGSNVNAVNAMTEIISLAREFDIQIKAMKAAEENSSAAAQLLRVN